MSVATNLRFGMRRTAPGAVRFDEVVELLGLGALLTRRPHTLSGGERQRVAIGRALLAQPHLLLMDEPLASLDAARKAEILPYLTRLKTTRRLPIIYVTHALDEVNQLADSLVLIEAGHVVGCGTAPEIAASADLPLAQRDDAGALLLCRVAEHDSGLGVDPPRWRRRNILGADAGCLPLRAECRVRIPAREVILAGKPPDAISLHNIVAGTVRRIAAEPARHAVLVEIALPHGALLSRVTSDAIVRLGLSPGSPVLALIKSTSIEVIGVWERELEPGPEQRQPVLFTAWWGFADGDAYKPLESHRDWSLSPFAIPGQNLPCPPTTARCRWRVPTVRMPRCFVG